MYNYQIDLDEMKERARCGNITASQGYGMIDEIRRLREQVKNLEQEIKDLKKNRPE